MRNGVPFDSLLAYPLRSGFTVASSDRGEGIRMLNMGELFAFPRISDVDMARVHIAVDNPERALLSQGDLMFARRSLTLEGAGKCSIVHEVIEPTTWESSIIRARLDARLADPYFYYYYFASPGGRRTMETIVEQVAAAGIRITDLARLRVPNPPLREQRAIAEVLSALDDKIAANTTLSISADSLVRAMYDDITATATETISVDEIVSNSRETVSPDLIGENVPYIGLEHVPRRLMWSSEAGSSDSVTSLKAQFRPGDILFGKLRPYFHKVMTAIEPGVCSTDILVLRSNPEISGFALAALSSDAVIEQATASSEGTRMPRASWKDLAKIEVPWPGHDDAARFSQSVESLRSASIAVLTENRTLASIRDALLPQLMSGKVRVKDADALVANAV